MGNYTVISFPKLGIDNFSINRFLTENLFGTGIKIAWYGAIICVGMIIAYFIIRNNATKKEHLTVDSLLDYFLFTIPLGIVGARAMYVLTNLDYYDSFKKIVSVWNGGLAIYGGVLVGIIVIFVTAKIKKDKPFAIFDAVIPGLLIAQSLGRWGNFINGEAHGTVTDAFCGMMVNYEGPFHPTFLYESILTFIGFLVAEFIIYRYKKFDGEVFSFYLIYYGIGRFFIEGLRTDSLYIGSVKASQLIGITSAICGIAIIVYNLLIKKKTQNETVCPVSAEEKSENEDKKNDID